jgi:hypothetical protein
VGAGGGTGETKSRADQRVGDDDRPTVPDPCGELIFLIEGANADESGLVATGNMNYRPNG